MEAKDRNTRYTEVASNEVKTQSFRLPVWTQAMISSHGDVKTAEAAYIALRVMQMEEDEAQQDKNHTARLSREQFEDETQPSRWFSKTLFVVFLAVLFGLLFFLLYLAGTQSLGK